MKVYITLGRAQGFAAGQRFHGGGRRSLNNMAKSLRLPVLAEYLSYAPEALGVFDKVNLFEPDDPYKLRNQVEALASGEGFEGRDFAMPAGDPVVNGLDELLTCITAQDCSREFKE